MEKSKLKKLSSELSKSVGTNIRYRRMELGLTQQDLAGHIGYSYQQLQKIEKGVNRASPEVLLLCSKHLKVPITYFFQTIQDEESLLQSVSRSGILKKYVKLTPKHRKVVDSLIDTLASLD